MRKRTIVSPLKEGEVQQVKDSHTSSTKKPYLDMKLKKDVVKGIPTDETIGTLTESIRRNPFDPELFYQRGTSYFMQGKTAEALTDFCRSIKINPQFVKSYYARAELWAALNNKRLALIDLEKAMELENLKDECDLNSVSLKEKEAPIETVR